MLRRVSAAKYIRARTTVLRKVKWLTSPPWTAMPSERWTPRPSSDWRLCPSRGGRRSGRASTESPHRHPGRRPPCLIRQPFFLLHTLRRRGWCTEEGGRGISPPTEILGRQDPREGRPLACSRPFAAEPDCKQVTQCCGFSTVPYRHLGGGQPKSRTTRSGTPESSSALLIRLSGRGQEPAVKASALTANLSPDVADQLDALADKLHTTRTAALNQAIATTIALVRAAGDDGKVVVRKGNTQQEMKIPKTAA